MRKDKASAVRPQKHVLLMVPTDRVHERSILEGIADYTERVVRRFLSDRDVSSDETFAQWAHRAEEDQLV